MDTLSTTGNDAIPLVTFEEIDQAGRDTVGLLDSVLQFRIAFDEASRDLDHGPDSANCLVQAWERFKALFDLTAKLQGKYEEVEGLICQATDNLQAVWFRGHHAVTAFDAAHMVAQVLCEDATPQWSAWLSTKRRPYGNTLKDTADLRQAVINDTRRLAESLQDVTSELMQDLLGRVETEAIQAKRFLIEHPPIPATSPVADILADREGADAEPPGEIEPEDPPNGLPSDLIGMAGVAKLVHLEKSSVRRYRKGWPIPDIQARGRAEAKWSYRRLLPVLKGQFSDRTLPSELPQEVT